MATSTTKTYLLGGCVLLGAWGISHLNSNKPIQPLANPKQEAVQFDPSTYIDPYGTTTCYPSSQNRYPKQYSSNSLPATGKYHYEVTITDARRDWETYEQEPLINGEVRLRKTSSDISEINGTYIWDMDEYLPNQDAMFNYILKNYQKMKQYKVSPRPKRKCDADEYNDRLDEYLADPEDESEFPPEIFDFLQD